jgi:hypothetical protein
MPIKTSPRMAANLDPGEVRPGANQDQYDTVLPKEARTELHRRKRRQTPAVRRRAVLPWAIGFAAGAAFAWAAIVSLSEDHSDQPQSSSGPIPTPTPVPQPAQPTLMAPTASGVVPVPVPRAQLVRIPTPAPRATLVRLPDLFAISPRAHRRGAHDPNAVWRRCSRDTPRVSG